MSPLGAMFVHEGAYAACCGGDRSYEQNYSPRPSTSRYSAIQCSPGSSPSSVLHTKATGSSSIVTCSPSLGTMPRKIDLIHGSIASSRAICRVYIASVVVDDVAALVDFQHNGQQRITEMNFAAQIALLYEVEAGTVARVGGQVETEEGLALPVEVNRLM